MKKLFNSNLFSKQVFFLSVLFMFSSTVYAKDDCEMPPGIDDDERYLIKFKGESQANRYKILDIDNCWVKTYRKDGNHYWRPVSSIVFIGSREYED